MKSKKKDATLPINRIGGASHGEHWSMVYRGIHPLDQLIKFSIQMARDRRDLRVISRDWNGPNVQTGRTSSNTTRCLISQIGHITSYTLSVNDHLWASYPYSPGSSSHDIIITEVFRWENLVEGQVACRVCGTELVFFDTHFFIHQGKLPSRTSGVFGAFGVRVKKVEKTPATGGAMVRAVNGEGYRDIYRIMMPVEEIAELEIFGARAYQFEGTMLNAKGQLRVPVIALAESIEGDVPGVGDWLSATIWLQGLVQEMGVEFESRGGDTSEG